MLGTALRELALLGAGGRLLTVGRVVAGWNWATATQHLICSPPREGEYASYALDTAVLILAVKGGTASLQFPSAWGGGGMSGLGMTQALQWAGVQQWATVSVNTGSLAAGAAVLRNGGLTVLMAQENGEGDAPNESPKGIFKLSDSVVLGFHGSNHSDEFLRRFADKVGGNLIVDIIENLHPDAEWTNIFEAYTSSPLIKSIKINLDLPTGGQVNVRKAIEEGRKVANGMMRIEMNAFNYELYFLYENKSLWNKITWYSGGVLKKSPPPPFK